MVDPATGVPVNAQPGTEPGNIPQAPPQVDENVQNLQRILNERTVAQYRLEQEVQAMRQQLAQQQQRPQDQAPDPNTDPQGWWAWRDKKLLSDARNAWKEELASQISTLSAAQQEQQFLNTHPGVDLPTLKMFAQQRQIGNLDDAYTLLTLPQTQAQLTTQAFQTTANQFMRPAAAQPVRGTQPAAQIPQASFERDAQDYIATNGRIADSWSPERRAAFDLEYKKREAAARR